MFALLNLFKHEHGTQEQYNFNLLGLATKTCKLIFIHDLFLARNT